MPYWCSIGVTEESHVVCVTGRRINMAVRRLGGGYGGKLQHPSRVAGAAAVAALALNRPVRLVLGINTNMTLLGSRLPYLIQYQVRQTDNIASTAGGRALDRRWGYP